MSDHEYQEALATLQRRRNWKAAFALSDERFNTTGDPAALVHSCVALLRDGDIQHFQSTLDKLASLNPRSGEVLRLKAMYAEKMGDLDQAETLWRQFIESHKAKAEPYLHIAAIYLQQKQYLRLARHIEILREKFPDHPKLRNVLNELTEVAEAEPAKELRARALACSRQSDWAAAREAWELLYVRAPGDVNALINICDTYLKQSNYPACSEVMREHLPELKTAKRFDEMVRRMALGLIANGAGLRGVLARPLLAEISATAIFPVIRALAREHRDDDLTFVCTRIEKRPDLLLRLQVATILADNSHLEWALRLAEGVQRQGGTNIDSELLVLRLLVDLGDRDRSLELARKLGAAADAIVATNARFVSYIAAYSRLFGIDATVQDLIRSAVRTLVPIPGNLFTLIHSLATQGSPELATLLLAEIRNDDAGITLRDEVDVLEEIFCRPEGQRRPEDPEALLAALRNIFRPDDPSIGEKLIAVAQTLHDSKRLLLLDRILALAAELAVESPQLMRMRAQLMGSLSKWADAAHSWGQIAANNPNDRRAQVERILALIRADRTAEAREEFDELRSLGESGLSTFGLASCAIQLGDKEAAKDLAIGLLEKSDASHLRQHQRTELARVLCLLGMPEKALQFYPPRDPLRIDNAEKLAVVLDPGLNMTSGHHVNYTLFSWKLIRDLVREGAALSPVVLCGKHLDDAVELADLRVVPALAFEPYAFDKVPALHRYLANLNSMFYQDLSALQMEDRARLIVVHSMKAMMIEGFSRWIDDIFRSSRGLVAICLIEVDHLIEAEDVGASFVEVYRTALQRLVANANISLLLSVETEFGKRFLDGLGIPDLEVRVFPYLAASLCTRYVWEDRRADKPIVLGTVGGTRPARGSYLFPSLIEKTKDLASQCSWKLQLNLRQLAGMMEDQQRPLIGTMLRAEKVDVVDDVLSSQKYFELLNEIDVVILPYQDRYAVSGSGVFYESLYLDKFLLVSRDSFMPAVLKDLDHPHLVLEENTLACLEESVRWIVDHQDTIKQQLAELQSRAERRLPADEFYQLLKEQLGKIG